jgi:hypothetical protein
MKLKLLRLNTASKPSPIFKGATEIRIDIQPCKGKTWQHDTHELEDTTSGHSSWRDQGGDQGPPHPSARLPRDIVMGICGWLIHYPDVHMLGMVG